MSPIWQAVAQRATSVRCGRLPELLDFLLKSENAHARALMEIPWPQLPSKDSARELEMQIISRHAQGHLTYAEASDWLGLVYAATKEMGRRGTTLESTRLSDYQPPEESPFAPKHLHLILLFARWKESFHLWLQKSLNQADRPAHQASIVLSAIMHGALLDQVKIEQLLVSPGSQVPFDFRLGLATIPFRLPYMGISDGLIQRWQPDPITAMLIFRLPENGPSLKKKALLNAIRNILFQGMPEPVRLPTSISEIIQSSSGWWSANGSVLDVRVAQRKVVAHGFNDPTWDALTQAQVSNDPHDSRSELSPRVATPLETLDSFGDLESIHSWLADVREVLAAENLDAARTICQEGIGQWPEDSSTYLGWLLYLLQGKSSSRNPLQLSTIRKRFLLTIPHLLNHLGTDNPAEANTLELEDIYAEILQGATADPIRELGAGLRDFHDFLVNTHGKSRVSNTTDIFGCSALKPVDASVITVEEYEETLAWIDRQTGRRWTQREKRICKLVLMLCFRTGCRRMEAIGLRLQDIHSHFRLFCLIRKHEFRRLKTVNAKRELPLFALLGRREQRVLREWIEVREAEDNEDSGHDGFGLIFNEFGKGDVSWADRMSRRINEALQAVTGRHVHIHTLRHSFATWTYLRLRAADLPSLARCFRHLPKTASMIRNGRRVRPLLISMGYGFATVRELAFCVARLLGHSSPQVSLRHYIHSADLILGALTWNAADSLPKPVLVAASGLASAAAYDRIENGGLASLLDGCRQKYRSLPPKESDNKEELSRAGKSSPAEISHQKFPEGWISRERCEAVLALSMDSTSTPEIIAANQGLTIDEVTFMLDMTIEWGGRFQLDSCNGRITRMPQPPRSNERRLVADLEWRLARVWSEDHDLFLTGVDTHLRRFDHQRKDVLFHGKEDVDHLRMYLKFLKRLGLPPERFEWVLRRRPDDDMTLPSWVTRLRLQWWPSKFKRIAPPVQKYEQKHGKWIGVLPLDDKGVGVGNLFATALLIAAMGNTGRG